MNISRWLGLVRQVFYPDRQNRPLWAISLGHAFTHWYPATFYIVLPVLAKELGLSYTEMGFIVTLRYMVSTVANVPAGIVVDVIGKRNLLMALSLAWVGVPYLIMGVSGSYAVILLAMALIGAGNNLWHPAAISDLSSRYPKEKGMAIGVHATAANLGDLVAPAVAGALLLAMSWQSVLVYNVVPGIVVAVVIWLMLRDSGSGASEGKKGGDTSGLGLRGYLRGFLQFLLNPNLLLLSLVSGIRSLTQNGLMTFLPAFFQNTMMMNTLLSGLYMGIIQAAGMVAAPISGSVSDRRGRKAVLSMGLLSTSIAVLLLALVQVQWLFVVALGIMGFFLFSLRPVIFAWTMETTPPEYGGTAVSVLFGVQSLFSSLAPVLGGWIADRWGLSMTFYFLAATILLANILILFVQDTSAEKPVEGATRHA